MTSFKFFSDCLLVLVRSSDQEATVIRKPLVFAHGYQICKARDRVNCHLNITILLALGHLRKVISLLESCLEGLDLNDKFPAHRLHGFLRSDLAICLDAELDGCEERVRDLDPLVRCSGCLRSTYLVGSECNVLVSKKLVSKKVSQGMVLFVQSEYAGAGSSLHAVSQARMDMT